MQTDPIGLREARVGPQKITSEGQKGGPNQRENHFLEGGNPKENVGEERGKVLSKGEKRT